jgi:hypothetical protein
MTSLFLTLSVPFHFLFFATSADSRIQPAPSQTSPVKHELHANIHTLCPDECKVTKLAIRAFAYIPCFARGISEVFRRR